MVCATAHAVVTEPDPAVLRAESQRIAVMHRAKDAVLAIFAADGGGGGSGVVISADGYALTNFHVAKPCGNAMKCGMPDGQIYDAVVVGFDPTGDTALIRLFGRDDFPHAEPADSDQVRTGDACFAMGNPFLLATDFQPTVTYGIVSGVHRYQYPSGTLLEYADCIQTDASINPGNSGGPLFDDQGQLVGINGRGSFEKRGRVNVGVAYAISIHQIKNFLGVLRSGRIVDHATLGAVASFDDQGRVIVSDILEQSDAYRRGLRYGDELVSFARRPITTPNGFKNVLGTLPKDWRVPLSYRRDGKRYDTLVRLRGVHGKEALLEAVEGEPQSPMPIPKPGEKKPAEKPRPGEKSKKSRGKQPQPDSIEVARGKTPMPQVCKEHFEPKRGYVNYYFNKLARDRVLTAWAARCQLAGLKGTWVLEGRLESGGKFRFELDNAGGRLKLPTAETPWEATGPLNSSLAPPQSGGLLPTLYALRWLAVAGPEKFDEFYCLGAGPLADRSGLVDVLVGLYKGIECRYYFDPSQGHLLAMEMFPDDDVDPCEIYFSEYSEVEGRWLPARIEVRVGDDRYALFAVDQWRFETAAEK
jgi:serine protease Do